MDYDYTEEIAQGRDRIPYLYIVEFHRQSIVFYVNLIIKDIKQSRAISEKVFAKYFQLVINKEDLQLMESSFYEEASLQAMSLLYGELRKHSMYIKQKAKLERFQIKTFVIQYISRYPEKFRKYLTR